MATFEAQQAFLNGRRLHLLNKLQAVRQDIVDVAAKLKDEHEPNRRSSLKELLSRKHQTVERITSALNRLTAGTYGICMHCRREINDERILKIPETELCMKCLHDSAPRR